MRRTLSSNAAKMLEILTPAIEQNSPISPSVFRQFDQGTDMMIKAQLRITQLRLDENIQSFLNKVKKSRIEPSDR
jgi:hypothetical protein